MESAKVRYLVKYSDSRSEYLTVEWRGLLKVEKMVYKWACLMVEYLASSKDPSLGH